MKITKRVVFSSSFVIIIGALLLGTAFYESFIFKPSLVVQELELNVNEEENTLTYKLQYSMSKNNVASIRLKNDFYEKVIFLNDGGIIDAYAVGSFFKLTKGTTYTLSLLENRIAVYSENITITYQAEE